MAERKDETEEEKFGTDPSNDASASDASRGYGVEQASSSREAELEAPKNVFEVWSEILLPKESESRHSQKPAEVALETDHANMPYDKFQSIEEERAEMKISLGLYARWTGKGVDGMSPDGRPDSRPDGRPDGRSPPLSNKADRLRVDVAIEFLSIVRAPDDYTWKQICEMIVPEPKKMAKRYQLPPNTYQEGEIQCLLTLDSIFLACYLMIFLDIYPSMIRKVDDLISNQARDAFHHLSLQILKPENQVPLDIISHVYKLLVSTLILRTADKQDEESKEDRKCREVTDFIVGRICAKFVQSNGFPSLYNPLFLGTKIVRQITVKVKSEDVVNPRSRQYACAIECRNLLHCQAEALWGSTFPCKYLIESAGEDDSMSQYVWRSISRPAIMHNSYPEDIKGAPQDRGQAVKIMESPEEVMEYEEELKAVVASMLKSEGLRQISKFPDLEAEHEKVVTPIVEAMRDAVASCQQKTAKSPDQKLLEKIGRMALSSLLELARNYVQNYVSTSNFEALNLGTEAPDPLTTSIPPASELNKYGVSVQGQEGGIFPRFERDRYRFWRATLYLPQIKFLGKKTKDRWHSVLEYEDKWTHCTGIWDDIMWLYRFRQQTPGSKQNKRASPDENGSAQPDRLSQSNQVPLPPGENVNTFNPKGRRKPFLSYMLMMDELVNTEADVEILLTGSQPVINGTNLGSKKAVAEFFSSATEMYANSKVDDPEWLQLKTQVRNFHNDKNRRALVRFLDENLGKPWVVGSLLAGLLISVTTSIQAFFSIKDDY